MRNSNSRPPRQNATETNVSLAVKWFNPDKGFGFASRTDGGPDVFLHASALASSGLTTISDGTTLICDLGQGPKGPQVVAIHEIDTSTATPGRARSDDRRPPGRGFDRDRGDRGGFDRDRGDRDRDYAPSQASSDPQSGTVKFFDEGRGFGFVAPANGGKDVFLHATALARADLPFPKEGQPVRFTTKVGKKGEEIADLSFE
jgi:cold shock protein